LKRLKRFISTIPPWAYFLVLLVLFVLSANLYQAARMPVSGEIESLYDGHWIIDYVKPGRAVDKAGIKVGDTIISCNHYPMEEWFSEDHGQEAGDTLIFGILRNNVEVGYPVAVTSYLSTYPGIYWSAFVFFVLVSIISLYILLKKPKNKAANLYFIYIQSYCIISIGGMYLFLDPMALLIAWSFLFSAKFQPAILIHFHLVFPKPARYFSRFGKLPYIIYGIAFAFFLFEVTCMVNQLKFGPFNIPFLDNYIRVGLWWTLIASVMALALAFYQLATIKETLALNQLRIIVIGTMIGTIFNMIFIVFYDYVGELWNIYPNLVQFTMRVIGLIITICLLVAILKYRIWQMEVVLKKVLLYLIATSIIFLSYLALLYLVDLVTLEETKTTRIILLALSVLILLVSRDWIQRLIEKIFHRESYDSATVVSEFEEKLAGVYRIADLGSRVLDGLNDIFHFNTLALSLKTKKLIYMPAGTLGTDNQGVKNNIEVSNEFENRLNLKKVFSPGELREKPFEIEGMSAELIVPLIKDNQPFGFFACGPKKSEKVYSMQDIRVLTLIAKRVVALFHTAELYQNDLDRQLMLERERARIAQDMHDDIGAGLTRIAMISEAGTGEQGKVSGEEKMVYGDRMLKIAGAARDMINRLNVIVWALNPRYDNLESLISYARRYFGEYLENFDIGFRMEVPEEIPDKPVTPDFRRNAFYAWQEAVHNAVKHGKCSEIIFEIRIDEQILFVTIIDNGIGFDRAKQGSGGNGLLNMKKRAEELGGRFEIESEVGKGTKLSFEF
jgi:signal transduction histidine kinase